MGPDLSQGSKVGIVLRGHVEPRSVSVFPRLLGRTSSFILYLCIGQSSEGHLPLYLEATNKALQLAEHENTTYKYLQKDWTSSGYESPWWWLGTTDCVPHALERGVVVHNNPSAKRESHAFVACRRLQYNLTGPAGHYVHSVPAQRRGRPRDLGSVCCRRDVLTPVGVRYISTWVGGLFGCLCEWLHVRLFDGFLSQDGDLFYPKRSIFPRQSFRQSGLSYQQK